MLETQLDAEIFVPHAYPEQMVDLGEMQMNYATAGEVGRPALLLIPAQCESWWGYERAIRILAESFQVFAVDLRGQGRSSRTPGRYTLDNMGNDLVRFIDLVIGREALLSGNSSGAVLAAWLGAYAKPSQVRAVMCEDPPLFASELNPSHGHSIRQAVGPFFAHVSKWLGDQWTVGDWEGMQSAAPSELPEYVLRALDREWPTDGSAAPPPPDMSEPPQELKEYDPEWARAFATGSVGAGCDHARMLRSLKVPLTLTHHMREIDAETGNLLGAISDDQVRQVRRLVEASGQCFDCIDLPEMVHSMHCYYPQRFAGILTDWAATLGAPAV